MEADAQMTDRTPSEHYLAGKKVLVTGGTGSIGSELVRQVLRAGPEVVRIYSRDESKQYMLAEQLDAGLQVRLLIGDVRDADRLRRAFSGIDVVFHAAALKHVPSCEYNPFEAVQTNVVGTENVLTAAIDAGVRRVVTVSTDKAVNPCHTMGATKLLAEKLVIGTNSSTPRPVACCVRFGNVLGSRGSLVPIIQQQVAGGGPVSITSVHATRFMMTIPEAAGLILKAGQVAEGGEIFILKMPRLRVSDLIDVLVKRAAPRSGRCPDEVAVRHIGLRPGENEHERLISEEELARTVELDDMYMVLAPWDPRNRELAKGARIDPRCLHSAVDGQPVLGKVQIADLLDRVGL